MSYYFLHEQKKIPGWIAYLCIGVLVLVFGFFLNSRSNRTSLVTRASKNLEPKNVIVSNLAGTSFSISFETSEAVTANIKYGTDGVADLIKFDDRDVSAATARKIHYFTLQSLAPLTNYTYQFVIDGRELAGQKTTRTLPSNVPAASNPPLFGKVTKTNLEPATDVLITATIQEGSQKALFSGLTKDTGEWIITTPYLTDGNGVPLLTTAESLIELTFTDGQNLSRVTTRYQNASPLQTVILGKDYQLTTPETNNSSSNEKPIQTLNVLYPANNAVISAQHPVFRGLAPASSPLEIVIQPNIESVAILSDSYGEWKYETRTALASGHYQFFIKSSRENKVEVVNFFIPKSGESVLGDATGSGTTDPTNTPAPTATRTPTPAATAGAGTPTHTPAPTKTPTPKVTVAPTRTTTPMVSISPTHVAPTVINNQIPTAGNNNYAVVITASAISLLGLFLVLY